MIQMSIITLVCETIYELETGRKGYQRLLKSFEQRFGCTSEISFNESGCIAQSPNITVISM